MFTTKIRTSIATLAATFTVALATAPVTPDAHARPNNGGYQNSSEAHKEGCKNLYGQYLHHISMAVQMDDAPGKYSNYGEETAAASDKRANEVRDVAKQGGCDWAA